MAAQDALGDLSAALAPQSGDWSARPAAPTGAAAALADLQMSPDELRAANAAAPKGSGVVANLAAGGNEMLTSIAGAPVDVASWALNKITSPFTGTASEQFGPETQLSLPPSMANVQQPPAPQPLVSNPVGGSESIKSALGLAGANPNNVIAATTPEQMARSVGGGAVGMAAPYLAGRAAIARGVTEGLPGTIARSLGGPAPADAGALRTAAGAAGNAAIGAGASLGGQGAEALLPPDSPYRPLANMAGQLVAGGGIAGVAGLTRAGLNTLPARNLLAPMMRQNSLDTLVGDRLAAASSDRGALVSSLTDNNSELVPGSMPTTFQASGDQGIGRLQAGLPQGPFEARAGEQASARAAALQGVAPGGDPGAVRQLLQQQLATIDQTGDANVAAARQNAQQMFQMAGGNLSTEDYGAAMREQLEAAKTATKQQESALWRAIDPDGKLTINANPVRDAANQILGDIPRTALQPQGEENAVLGIARMGGSAMPFSDFTALRGRLLQAIRDERDANGQSPALRRMQQLRSAMDDTISNAAVTAAERNPDVVDAIRSNGPQPGVTDSLPVPAGRADVEYGNSPGIGQLRPMDGPEGISGSVGNQILAAGGPDAGRPNPAISGDAQPVANFGPDNAAAYRAAADATRQRAATFNNQLVGPALVERGNEYRMLDSRVPERFMSSPEGVQAFLAADGDPKTLQAALVADLRQSATAPDGSLNPTKFASWQMKRAPALRAFPELQQTLGNVAQAQQAVDAAAAAARAQRLQYQQGAARHFLNAEPTQAVRSALSGRNPVGDMVELARMTGSDPDAKAGLQRAVADYIASRFVTGTGYDAAMPATAARAQGFNDFLSRNAALAKVFSPDQMQAVRSIAADLNRGATPLPKAQPAGGSLLRSLMGGHGASLAAGLAGFLTGGAGHAAIGGIATEAGKKALGAVRASGLSRIDDLLTEALLNPELAHTLLMKATPANRPFIERRLAQQLGALGVVSGTQTAVAIAGQNQPPPTSAPPIAPRLPIPRVPPMPPPPAPALVPGEALRVGGGLLGAAAQRPGGLLGVAQ